ncbi:hypothetical protein A2U01_0048866, partial [Trifolium medium]|nr:hypothetical protein [Trifolium medium]
EEAVHVVDVGSSVEYGLEEMRTLRLVVLGAETRGSWSELPYEMKLNAENVEEVGLGRFWKELNLPSDDANDLR